MARQSKQARHTRQLQVVWDAVKVDKSHPTAEQIYAKVRGRLPNISLATVYRNLQKLVADRKLQVLILGRSQHFDPLVARHQHFICQVCDSVFDVLIDGQSELTPTKLPHEGFQVTSQQLAFYGNCKHCSR